MTDKMEVDLVESNSNNLRDDDDDDTRGDNVSNLDQDEQNDYALEVISNII